MQTSVVTLVRGRREHLANLIRGLNVQSELPAELVIAWMQPPEPAALPATVFPIRHLEIEGEALPLAKARNRGAAAAKHPGLIFLDVDCIPSPGLVAAYAQALAARAALYLGEVAYLPAGAVARRADGGLDFDRLDRLGQRHPARPAPPADGIRHEPDHGQLWGLSFALRAAAHEQAGGFDEAYIGYGGEETDYGCRLAAIGLEVYWLAGARAWHQQHPVYRPPYPHFDAILANASRFHARWGRWCMDYWLGLFCEAGLIDWSPAAEEIRLLRRPTAAETAAARLGEDARYG